MEGPIVLFDGECRFCNGTVGFIVDRDPKGVFRFLPLQSPMAADLLERSGLPTRDFDTVVLVEGERAYVRSTAILRIARRLRWPWPIVSALLVIPRFLRDAAYRFVAKRRFRWFGREDRCVVPSEPLRQRFLDV